MFDEGFVLGLAFGGGDIKPHTATQNGVYHASDENCDGFDPFTVDLALDGKYITENGVYTASDDELAGYDAVEVNIRIDEKTINANGVYTAESPVSGYSPVIVRVPSWKDAKDFYQNGGTGVAGVGGRGYVDELMHEIVGSGEHVVNETNTGWIFSIGEGTSAAYPENGFAFRLQNTGLGVDDVPFYINGGANVRAVLRDYVITQVETSGGPAYQITGHYSGVNAQTGTVMYTTTFSSVANPAYTPSWEGYYSGTEYTCTVS